MANRKNPLLSTGSPFNRASDLILGVGAAVTRSTQGVLGDDVVHLSPQALRDLMLTVEGSIQGHFLEMLGQDEAERVETMVRLLEGSTTEDLNQLARITQQAVMRLRQIDQTGGLDGSPRQGRGSDAPVGREGAQRP